jgi:hypothetical protein
MPSDIIELQHKLSENRGTLYTTRTGSSSSSNSSSSKYYRPRTAAATATITKVDHSQDANELLELGVSPHEVSDLLGMSLSEIARIQEYNQKKRKFLMTGNLDYI